MNSAHLRASGRVLDWWMSACVAESSLLAWFVSSLKVNMKILNDGLSPVMKKFYPGGSLLFQEPSSGN